MLVVAALGGNALMRRGEPLETSLQRANLARAADALAPIAREHRLVVTHGNGPQVGLLALQAAACKDAAPAPLDVLGAESEGMIGYLIEQALAERLPDREFAALITQVEIDPSDPAFATSTKPIGPIYAEAEARAVAARTGWTFTSDGAGWRRAVASPAPQRIRETKVINLLERAGVVVICAGGGGIPVAAKADGALMGVEAVIDKDLSAALLAEELGADALLLLTDVAAVRRRWPDGEPIGRTTPAEMRKLTFAPGSMAPKVEAACRFVERTGGTAAIGDMTQAQALLCGEAGTIIVRANPTAAAP
jgi:carbamate kinase